MIGWKKNQDCPICKKAVLEGEAAFETPSAFFPGLGKPFGDFLDDEDPLQEICRKRVHLACWLAWPERARFAAAWTTWKRGGVKDDPEHGEAFQDAGLVVVAPADPDVPDARVRLLFPQVAATEDLPPSQWPSALEALAALPLLKEALAGAAELRRRFPDARALAEAVDWNRKPTPCQICQGILGATPTSPAVYRLPLPAFWPSTPDARGLRPFGGALVHTACYLGWSERARFVRVVADVERRLAKLDALRAVAPIEPDAFLLAAREAGRRETAIELHVGEARVPVEAASWAQAALPDRLRPFEREAVLRALPALAAKYPTATAFLESLDWTAKEVESYQALADQIDECRRLVQAARRQGLRCPRCVAKLSDLEHVEGGSTVDCPRCGSELTPMEFGWLP